MRKKKWARKKKLIPKFDDPSVRMKGYRVWKKILENNYRTFRED